MENLKRPYSLGVGTAQCTNCGKGIRKYYLRLDNTSPLCSKCVNKVFNLDISTEELSIPIWLIELTERYFQHRLYLLQYRGIRLERPSEFALNFLNPELNGGMVIGFEDGKNTVNRKPIKPGHLLAVQHQLMYNLAEYRIDEQKSVRNLLVCPNCKQRMYYTGTQNVDEQGHPYKGYMCLSTRQACANSNAKLIYGHFGGNNIKRVGRQR